MKQIDEILISNLEVIICKGLFVVLAKNFLAKNEEKEKSQPQKNAYLREILPGNIVRLMRAAKLLGNKL